MNSQILDKQILMMTGREFLELFGIIKDSAPIREDYSKKELVYGLDGLAKLLDCGKTKAQQIKNSGIIDEAIIQNGKKLIIDKNKALELLKK
jgi:hypothetical protein